MNFTENIKNDFKTNNNFNVLIYINLLVFAVIKIVDVFAFFYQTPLSLVQWLAVPSDMMTLLRRPWTVISYMFTHCEFLHIFFNLLVFYWFGKLFIRFLSQRQLLGVYILGGLAGAFTYILAFNMMPVFAGVVRESVALGASASIMAVVIAVATLVPNQDVYMLFIGAVKLKYIAIIIVAIDILSIPVSNAGGHIAHLGGALLGFIFVVRYRKGRDITIFVSKILDGIKRLFKSQPKTTLKGRRHKPHDHESDSDYNARKKKEQAEIDKILEKIAQSGYGSLTESEKEKLFKQSNRR